MSTVIDARDVSKKFVLRHNAPDIKARALGMLHAGERARTEEFWALRGVSLRIPRGDAIGLVGRNGSGKSTFLKLIAGIHRPSSGQLLVEEQTRIGSMIELGTGFHPELTGQENVLLNTAIHGLTRAEALAIYGRIVDYSGLQHFMDVPFKNYSSGMHMRLGFAIAANMDPDVLLLDEIFAVGDEEFQKQCMATLQSFVASGRTILFVSHAPAAVRAICRRVCVLDRGELQFDGDVEGGLLEYRRLTARTPRQAVRAEDQEAAAAAATAPSVRNLAETEGEWVYEFLLAQGLRPDHYVLDVGCGSFAAAARLLPYMVQSHYWGYEQSMDRYLAGVQSVLPNAGVSAERGHFVVNEEFDFSDVPHTFEFAIASSMLRRLPLHAVARCFASVVRRLRPGGRFFVSWAEPGPDLFEPREQPDGTTTAADWPPYHHDFDVLARFAELAGGRAERLRDAHHPRGESLLVITRRS
jgi:ABC-type polysaccharide/polyol phosphate transport system ATPase subunit